MSVQEQSRQQSRMLFVKNLNYGVTGADLYELFGRYGALRQVRIGDVPGKTKGTAFVVYDEVGDAKNALDHLNGFHLQERYIVEYAKAVRKMLAYAENESIFTAIRALRTTGPAQRDSWPVLTHPFPRAVLYHMPSRASAKVDLATREAELEKLKQKHNIAEAV